MKNYTVLKGFYKLTEKKNYEIGDTIELDDVDAENMLKYDLVANIELPKKTKK